MELTRDNYYTPEADKEYMSCSQYQDFMDCEARALAMLEGRWQRKESEAFLVGNYFHTHMESPEAHEQFCNENLDKIFKTKVDKKTGELVVTGKYAPYVKADAMIDTITNDPVMKKYVDLPGENEKIMVGELFQGVPWKIRLDKYLPDKRTIIDYKTCANIQETAWNPITKKRETFVEVYGYMMRAAVYCEIEKQNSGAEHDPRFILLCVSKQDIPDKEIVLLNHRQRFDYELEILRQRVFHILDIKAHRVLPKRCGCCDYCRSTKKITSVIPYYQLAPENREEREDDYAIETEAFFNTL